MIIKGVVKRYLGNGKALGFPTANLELDDYPPEGIYLARTRLGEKALPSLVFVGKAETFNDTSMRFEVYILDFSQDLYGQEIRVELLDKIRDNQKFDSQEELVAQMKKDEEIARQYFNLTA